MGNKSLLNEATNWQNDPWKARDQLIERGQSLLKSIADNINPSESQFFYNKNQKHIKDIGKKISALEKAIQILEKV